MKSLMDAVAYVASVNGVWMSHADVRWAQRWAKKHGVKKLARDYAFKDAQVKQMAKDYGRKK